MCTVQRKHITTLVQNVSRMPNVFVPPELHVLTHMWDIPHNKPPMKISKTKIMLSLHVICTNHY